MSTIYHKISCIQQELLKESFTTKKGFHGEYIPLPVMLPPVLRECSKQELTLYFTSTSEHLMLKLMSWDGKEEFSSRVRLPELTSDEKKEGARITYLKRYLLMNTFMIIEDSIDPDDFGPEGIQDVTPELQKELNFEELLETALTKLKKKGLSDDEINFLALKNCMLKLDKWNKEEKKQIIAFCKSYIRDKRREDSQ